MKKLFLISLIVPVVIISWCVKNWATNIIDENQYIEYEWNLKVQWVWPVVSLEPTVEEDTLVLRWDFEDHTDHVFVEKWMREQYFTMQDEYLPLNTVKFKWYVEFIDWAAWNHYYQVKEIETLKLHWYPSEQEIKSEIEAYNYCENDDDCELIAWECPFGCYIATNKQFSDTIWEIIFNYFEHNWWQTCVYGCLYASGAICENNKCVVVHE